jgi:oxygen-independent coproporphyrinogen-3 oxidase
MERPMNHEPIFDPRLLSHYDVSGPRYTSYPTAPHFSASFNEDAYRRHARASNDDPIPRPLSIYVHIPFCSSPCFYCGCNRVVTRDRSKAEAYLQRLAREVEMQSALFDRDRRVTQLHLGGGTPNYLDAQQLGELVGMLRAGFNLATGEEREFSVELDPRHADEALLRELAAIGFNRVSFGVQDFDPVVQEAINRIQPVEQTLSVIQAARAAGFRSVSIDLIYGLPKQTVEGFAATIDRVTAIRPDRIAVYSYAHLPEIFKAQRQIDAADLPQPAIKLELLGTAVRMLAGAGYHYIGMDHFALPGDELVRAQEAHTLQRNFQGYSTHADTDLIGLGVSAIGRVGDCFAQNARDVLSYYAAIDSGHLPVAKGYVRTAEDNLRGDVIQELMCHGELDFDACEHEHPGLDFDTHFAAEIRRLGELARDGLVELDERAVRITPRGRLLMRIVAMAFDEHLARPREQQVAKFSRVI